MIDRLTAALVQSCPGPDDLDAIAAQIERAPGQLVVFPELALTGFPVEGRVPTHRVGGSAALDRLAHAARAAGVHAVVGFAEENPDGRPFNSAALFGPAGLVGVVRKRHLPGLERDWFSPGGPPTVLATEAATFGVVICYDAWFPEYVKALALAGAEIIVNINSIWAGGRGGGIGDGTVKRRYWATVPVARALDTQTYVLAVNGFGQHDFGPPVGEWQRLGRSRIVDPVGRVVAAAPADQPAVLTATLTDAALRRARHGIALLADSHHETP